MKFNESLICFRSFGILSTIAPINDISFLGAPLAILFDKVLNRLLVVSPMYRFMDLISKKLGWITSRNFGSEVVSLDPFLRLMIVSVFSGGVISFGIFLNVISHNLVLVFHLK